MHFGLKPADFDEMSLAEVNEFVRALNELANAHAKAKAKGGGKRGR